MIRGKTGWRLHGDERHDLQQVALNHVANCASLVIERGALANPHGFRRGDLHMVDVAMIPNWFKQ